MSELNINLLPTMEVFHLNLMDEELSRQVNAGGWNCNPRATMYCDITMLGNEKQVDAVQAAWSEGGYTMVAWVDGNDLDVAFERTNNIREPGWHLNEGVSAVDGPHRSTSVGDIIRKGGKLYLCASFGWTELAVA